MADEILDFLRERFNRLEQRFDDVERTLRDHTERLGRLERWTADLHGDFVSLSARLDGFELRLERIERRLDLVEG